METYTVITEDPTLRKKPLNPVAWTRFWMLFGVIFLLVAEQSTFAQTSLYRDIKAHQVGDVITIILMENISGSATSDANQTSSADGSTSGSATGSFLPIEPVFGANTSVNYTSDERNLASQQQLLEGLMSVQIVDVSPSGDLIVEGSRATDINGERHRLTLNGIVRPTDVDSHNRVLSYRVANADITYEKEGRLSELSKRRGFLRRTVFMGVTMGLGAVILMNELN